jgi:tetratricopeptide (TPR) repeat protein
MDDMPSPSAVVQTAASATVTPDRSATLNLSDAPPSTTDSVTTRESPPRGDRNARDGSAGSLVHRAAVAVRSGEFEQAKVLYTAALAKNPRDAEALSGLGDLARAQGDRAGAVSSYQRALEVSPAFFPALLGLADTLWEDGERAGAQKRYAELAERFPDVPDRVRIRATVLTP